MNIKRLELTHFGKFHLKTIEFTTGVNVVYGKNETGKSTIHAFVRSMLFGMPDTPEGRERYEHYLPWKTPEEYCGKLWITKGDRLYRIERSFLKEAASLKVFDETEGTELEHARSALREILGGLSETNYLNTICIEQLKSAAQPQLAKQLQSLVINTSQSKNIRINVEDAKRSLQKKKEALESQLAANLPEIQQGNEKLAAQSQVRLNQLQQSRYIREKQSAELEKQLEREKKQAEEDMLAYERERDERRRSYESDKKACESVPQIDEKELKAKSYTWLFMLLLALMFGAATVYLYCTRGFETKVELWLITIGACLTFVCVIGIIVAVMLSRQKMAKKRVAWELSSQLHAKLQASLQAFEDCKKETPRSAEERCKPLEEQYAKAQRELSYLLHQQREEQKILNSLESQNRQIKAAEAANDKYQEEIEAVNMALKVIRRVSCRIHDTFGNLLNSEASRLLFRVTDGRYEKLTIDSDMNVVIYAEDQPVRLESVSRGTIEQIYLCIRVAAAKLLWQEEPMPFLFDDVFAYYDDERLAAAMKMLKSCGHQVIIFSCHSREDQLL